MPRTPIHPGEHLAEELRELGMSAAELSRQIDVPVNRITGIIHGQRGITADTALRLGHWFGTSPQFWMNLQQNYELRLAESQVGAKIAVLPRRATRHEFDPLFGPRAGFRRRCNTGTGAGPPCAILRSRAALVLCAGGAAGVAPAVVNVYAAKTVQTRNPLFDDPIFRRFFGVPGELAN